jgi:hypothetical protein
MLTIIQNRSSLYNVPDAPSSNAHMQPQTGERMTNMADVIFVHIEFEENCLLSH